MLELATKAFYNHGQTLGGILLVVAFCGAMIVWGAYVWYTNFGPPAKRRGQEVPKP